MKVTRAGGPSQTSGVRPAGGGGGGGNGGGGAFRVGGVAAPAAPASVSNVSGVHGVMGVEAILALQDVESATERKRRSVGRAGRLLDELDELKIALLGGDLGQDQLDRLARTVREQRAATEDPRLEAILDEIETRAAVELAKLDGTRSAA